MTEYLMVAGRLKIFALSAAILFLAAGFAVAVWPEREARPLTPSGDWTASEHIGQLKLSDLPAHMRQVHRSMSGEGELFRTWTPEAGAQPGEVTSPPFVASEYMLVTIAGTTATPSGGTAAELICDAHPRSVPVFRGDVNINITEAIVRLPRNWCPGQARVHLIAQEAGVNVGVGSVAAVSMVSALKHSALGLLPYLVATFAILSLIALAGATAARVAKLPLCAPIAGVLSIGLISLVTFLLYGFGPNFDYGAAIISALTLLVGGFAFAAWRDFIATLKALTPEAGVWLIAALGYFLVATLAYNGLGHWEPNFRFSPAYWSSDNELPWLFAEGLRQQWDLPSVFGHWSPTDRPPLMTGMHLVVADALAALQSANDGDWLRGPAYNTAAIAINTLWAPVLFLALRTVLNLSPERAAAATLVAAITPFLIFNSIYGWPKLISAAFAGLAICAAFSRDERQSVFARALVFGAASAFSILCHASSAVFLLPLALFFLAKTLWRHPVALIAGAALGVGLLAPFALYQEFVHPSANPLLRYALTGQFGFGDPQSVSESVRAFYAELSFTDWVEAKTDMLTQLFAPTWTPYAGLIMAKVHGAGLVDMLRQADFQFMSGGNVVLVIAGLIAAFVARRDHAVIALLLIVVATYLAMVALFFSPIVIHTTPYGALLALALAGLGGMAKASPRGFLAIGLAAAAYSITVWVVLPLQHALYVDPLALAALVAVAALALTQCLGATAKVDGP